MVFNIVIRCISCNDLHSIAVDIFVMSAAVHCHNYEMDKLLLVSIYYITGEDLFVDVLDLYRELPAYTFTFML